MATEFSDIYIDGITTEELYADGGRIVEAWLDGECIWRLKDKVLALAKRVIIWIRRNDKYYGIGEYLLSDKAPYDSWKRVFFRGKDIENMTFNYVEEGLGENDVFYNNFTTNTPVSLYEFGYCIFPWSAVGINTDALPRITILPSESIYSTNMAESASLQDVLGDEYVNISDPLGAYCSVFSNRYQIRGSSYSEIINYQRVYGYIEVYDMKNNTVIYVPPSGELSENTERCRTRLCAKMGNRIYFPVSYSPNNYLYGDVSLFYIDILQPKIVEKIKIDITIHNTPEHKIVNIAAGPIATDNSKIVFLLIVTLSDPGVSTYRKYVLSELKGTDVSTAQLGENQVISGPIESNSGAINIIGSYIVVFLNNPYGGWLVSFYAGKTINSMRLFQYRAPDNNYGRPQAFYEEDGNLFYDEIYTYESASTIEPVSSKVRKNKIDFESGNILMESETEINGMWEE